MLVYNLEGMEASINNLPTAPELATLVARCDLAEALTNLTARDTNHTLNHAYTLHRVMPELNYREVQDLYSQVIEPNVSYIF